MVKKKEDYVAPPRTSIVNEVHKLVPSAPLEILQDLDFTLLYSIHSEVVCYGMDPEGSAELNIPGYKSEKDVKAAKNKIKSLRKSIKMEVRARAQKKKVEARAKAQAGRARARAARDRARAKRK